MTTNTLSPKALSVIDKYLHFKYGNAVCSVPYYNNKTRKARAAMKVEVGKGNPEEILDEVRAIILKHRIDTETITNDQLKKLLTDNNIGIDCSGFAYYVLDAESKSLDKGSLAKKISLVESRGIFSKLFGRFRMPANIDVATLADDENSRVIGMREVRPGDMITMISEETNRNHILIVHKVEGNESIPKKIHYSHAVAYPENGLYGSGIKQGVIEITKHEKSILDQRWVENSKADQENQIYVRAQKSKTQIRRLNWL